MPFKKGDKKIPSSGRRQGVKNRSTEEMRQLLQKIIDSKLETLSDDLDDMKPAMRWAVAEKLMKYFMPTLSKSDVDNTNSGTIDITIRYEGDDNKNDVDED